MITLKQNFIMILKNPIVLFAILLFSLSNSFSQENQLKDSLNSMVSKYLDNNNPPGLALCVIKEGRFFWSNSYGFADIEKGIPMRTDIIMNIASISKTITITAVLQLWEKGALSLEDDVNEYLDFKVRNPNYPEVSITIKQLLTHSSSINDNEAYGDSYICGDPAVTLEDWISNYFKSNGKYYDEKNNFHAWKPSEAYKYSNVAYGLLGLIVEKISKQSFSEYCKANIMTPLGMNNSAWFIKDVDTLNQSKQYAKASKENKDNEWVSKLITKQVGDYFELCNYSFYNYPDGLFKTTITELSYFMMAMMNQGSFNKQQILKKTTVSKMLSLQLEENNTQGLGWKKINTETSYLWGHSGRDPGVRAHMYFNPETKVGVILFQNNGDGNTINLIKDINSLMIVNDK